MEQQERNTMQKESQTETKRKIERIALISMSAVSVAVAICCHCRMKKVIRLMSDAVDDVSKMTVVDVQQGIINRAIDVAVHRKMDMVVDRAVKVVEADVASETQKRVRAAVQQSYGTIQKTVSEAIAKEAAKVDRNDIVREATERAKEALVKKFDGQLDNLLADYNHSLESIRKIYQSIASSMSNGGDKDITLKIG